MQMDADTRHREQPGMTDKEHLAFIEAQRPKHFEVARDIIAVRGAEFKRLGYGPTIHGDDSHPWLWQKKNISDPCHHRSPGGTMWHAWE